MIDTYSSSPKKGSIRKSKGKEEVEKQVNVMDKEYIRQMVFQGLNALQQV